MSNKEKLKKILAGITYSDSGVKGAFKLVEKEMQKVADKLRENAEMKTVEMTKKRITEIKEQIQSIFDYISKLKEDLKKSESDLTGSLNQKLDALKLRMVEYRSASLERLGILSAEMDGLKEDIREISQKKVEIPNFENQILKTESQLGELIIGLREETGDKVEGILTETRKAVGDLEEEIKKMRRDTMTAMASRGGGNMNRNILVGGNPSTLGRYTDLNILAGANVTLTYTNNDNLKTTNLTIGAAAGSGVTRNISTVIVSSVIAAAASTDYVIVANAGIQLTLPTAVGNTNLVTVKNVGTSSVLIATTGGQTIDGDTTIIMPLRYTAVDLISDDANWNVT